MEADSIRARLDESRLPVLPAAIPHLLTVLTDEEIAINELARILERFPTIVARLIALANSAWSSPASDVTSLEAACARLGFNIIRSVSIALAIAQPFNPKRCQAFDAERYWCSALLTADAATWLSPISQVAYAPEPETARVGGLLHNLGLLWLADCLPQETTLTLQAVAADPDLSLQQVQQDHYGFDYAQAGVILGQAWGFPSVLVAAMGHLQSRDNESDTDRAAALLADISASMVSAHYRGQTMPADTRWQWLEIDSNGQKKAFADLGSRFDRTRQLAKTLFTS